MGGQRHAPAALPAGKKPLPIVQEAWWVPGPVWTGAENFIPMEISSPDGLALIESLSRLSYPGPSSGIVRVLKYEDCGCMHKTLTSGRDESRNARSWHCLAVCGGKT